MTRIAINIFIFNILCISTGYLFQVPVGELMVHPYWWTIFIIFAIIWGILGILAEQMFPDSWMQRFFVPHLNGQDAKTQKAWAGVSCFFFLGYSWAIANALFFGSNGNAPLFNDPKALWANYRGEEFIELTNYRLDTNQVNYMFLRRENSDDEENGAYIYFRLEVADSQQIYPIWFMGDYETDNVVRQKSELYPDDKKAIRRIWEKAPKETHFFRATHYNDRYTSLIQQQNLMNEAAKSLREKLFASVPSTQQLIFLFPISFDPNTWRTLSKFALIGWILFANVMFMSMLKTARI